MLPELSNLLRQCITETLEDKVAIAFSGGLDSTFIASIAKNSADTELYTCGTEDAEDLRYAKELAAALAVPLHTLIVKENEILDTYNKCHAVVPGDLLTVELLVPAYRCAEAAKESGHEIMLFGCGAEELFVGYEKYYTRAPNDKPLEEFLHEEFLALKNREVAWISKICRIFKIEARYPFYNNELEGFIRALPIERVIEDRERKKGLLREAGKMLGVPEPALQRKKKAIQYGSGIHKILLKHAKDGTLNAGVPS